MAVQYLVLVMTSLFLAVSEFAICYNNILFRCDFPPSLLHRFSVNLFHYHNHHRRRHRPLLFFLICLQPRLFPNTVSAKVRAVTRIREENLSGFILSA